MNLSWRHVSAVDVPLLAEWNHELIQDEGHRNPMSFDELADRMKGWLRGEYSAVLFSQSDPIAYALYKRAKGEVYLRQFFVRRDQRRRGVGRRAIAVLKEDVWPSGVRLTVDALCRNVGTVAFWRSVGYRDYCLTLEIMPST